MGQPIENQMCVGNGDHEADLPQWAKAQALDDVVGDILTHGEYPRPTGRANHVCRFDLCEWVTEHYSSGEIIALFTRLITDFSNEAELARLEASDKLEKLLRDELEDDEIVLERADEIFQGREA